MANRVLDSSVLIAIANKERYDESFLPLFDGAVMSAVNFAEVITRLLDLGMDVSSTPVQLAFSLLSTVAPFTATQAQVAGELRRLGKHVALGDRDCIALAVDLGAEIFTTDGEWAEFGIPVKVNLIR